ncbi:unnamed protein product [Protopolystoma xenopodis]|uniref:Uncharacterized protein n=1 Tax=Protopolystoma xenopodis TaxID=117903 RepID=A0A448XI18_9PLAT|nr:unnamed protein product [Protopolystoma xenopodis]
MHSRDDVNTGIALRDLTRDCDNEHGQSGRIRKQEEFGLDLDVFIPTAPVWRECLLFASGLHTVQLYAFRGYLRVKQF